jgi:glycosyltransferase involved in cell wall biosynthesis
MRVGVDACCWSNRRGFGRFTRDLVTKMVEQYPQHQFTLLMDDQSDPAEYESPLPAGATIKIVETGHQQTQAASADGSRSPADLWRLSRAATRLDCDVFFFPAVYTFFPLLRRVPCVVTFHDAIAENHPGMIFPSRRAKLFWDMKCWLARKQADRILTVSQDAKKQILSAFGCAESSVRVVTEGFSSEFAPAPPQAARDAVQRYKLPADRALLLYVGGISPHKNLQGLLHALRRLADTCTSPWHMVIVGDYQNDSFYGCYDELRGIIQKLNLGDQVTFTGFVPNSDLVALYGAATMLVLPSFAEGFGLPAVEAMACGLPVVVSDRGSLPEVVGSAGVLFNPDDPQAMADAIAQVLVDPNKQQAMRDKGLARAATFSWEASARQTVSVLEEVCASPDARNATATEPC